MVTCIVYVRWKGKQLSLRQGPAQNIYKEVCGGRGDEAPSRGQLDVTAVRNFDRERATSAFRKVMTP